MTGLKAILWGVVLTFGSLALLWWISTLTAVTV